MTTYRTFIAIELPAQLRALLKDHIDRLRAAFPEVRASWSRQDSLHLTLKFLGEVPVTRISGLSAACEAATHSLDSFALEISDCGTFPPTGKPKVLWIGVANPGERNQPNALTLLHAAVEDACDRVGFAREPRAYHPHLTIARLRETKDSRALAEYHRQTGFAPATFTVSELVLFKSELSSKGSKHTALSRHELNHFSMMT